MIVSWHSSRMPVSAVWPDCSGLTAFFIPAERKCSPLYQALYRKWRPQIFDDVVGQSHITQTLKKQVQTNRLSHAYLFTGTRGTWSDRLMLLGSPPDMVHGLPLRGTVTSNVTAGASGIVLYLPPFRKGLF